MRQRTQVHRPRIPLGCDQQGRYPEAYPIPAEACTELGQKDEPLCKVTDLATSLTIAVAVMAVIVWML